MSQGATILESSASFMMCGYCRFSIPDGEHRCPHCGRRPGAPSLAAVEESSTAQVGSPLPEIVGAGPAQPSLFASGVVSNVASSGIPSRNLLFQVFRKTPSAAVLHTAPLMDPAPRGRNAGRSLSTQKAHPAQSTIEFLPAAPPGPRKLKTTVEAVIFCNEPVAAPLHRLLASALDTSMILIAFGIFSTLFYLVAGPLVWDTLTMLVFGASFGLIALFYGLIWAMLGRETAGMNWMHLRLIDFDGFAPNGKTRALRMAGGWLSVCSGTIGLWWALVDEENLTWHDHMSKTFPTLRESNSTFFQQR